MSRSKLAPGICVKSSPIDGKGCYATQPFKKRHKIAEYEGEIISSEEVERRLQGRRRIHICAIDDYRAIDGDVGGNGTQYINHSCQPNCYTRIVYGHVLFLALRDIEPGEEITLDYLQSYHSDETRCHCRAPNCRGTINLIK